MSGSPPDGNCSHMGLHAYRFHGRSFAVFFLLGLSAVSIASERVESVPADTLAALDALFSPNISSLTPGCAVGVRHGQAEVQRAYGQADLERDVANTTGSVFNAGSVSKQFTAAAVLLLASDGKLALDDDVRKYLPELPPREHKITIEQLLGHTSGLRDFRATDWLTGRDALPQNNTDVLAYAARQHGLNHAPGESHLYTNTGYALLAIIVERASGQPFADFTRERLFKPAGMEHTQWETDVQRLVPYRSAGYAEAEPAHDGRPARFALMPTARHVVGNGGLLTTVGDLLRWSAALQHDAFGPQLAAQLEQRARLRNGAELDYARGVFVGRYRGLREVQHGGFTGTYRAWLGFYPEEDLSIALLCNGADIDAHALADLFLPASRQAAVTDPPITAKSADLSGHSGLYRATQDDRLMQLDFPKDAPLSDGRYLQGASEYAFDATHPDEIIEHRYGQPSTWARVPASTPEASALLEYVDHYASDELLATYEVSIAGTQLVMSIQGLSDLKVPLQPVAKDVFIAQGVDIPVEFRRDDRGRIAGLVLSPARLGPLMFARTAAAK
jgi:CubicO group peptidase (beta-lactamase class C family)